jgi:hypothetical protein
LFLLLSFVSILDNLFGGTCHNTDTFLGSAPPANHVEKEVSWYVLFFSDREAQITFPRGGGGEWEFETGIGPRKRRR